MDQKASEPITVIRSGAPLVTLINVFTVALDRRHLDAAAALAKAEPVL
jgi:hypothetical protein